MDFNNYHAGQQKNNQPAVITGTPPQKSAHLSTLDKGSAEINRSAIDQMLASKGVAIDKVLNFEVPDSLLVERVTGRLVHPASGRSYHEKFAPPKVSMTDDVTGEPLIRRKDDNADTLKARLSTFHSQTAPVIDYYKKQGALVNIKADNPFDKVKTAIFGALNK